MNKCETCRYRIKIRKNPNIYICTYKKDMNKTKDKCVQYQSKEEDE